jgi:DNA uptake protein ComE-like DNA-binding protein
MVLVVVLVIIAILTLAGYSFSELMLAERRAAQLSVQKAQARALADSGVEMARQFVLQDTDTQSQLGGWYDNPQQFRGVLVVNDQQPQRRGRFTIVAPRVEQDSVTGVRFGLEDESARLNLNWLLQVDKTTSGSGRKILMGLPGMTEDIADAILDWIDGDDQPREFGAEADYYSAQVPPYAPKNGLLETVEELLLVRDITPGLLFGSDAKRNGLPSAIATADPSLSSVDNSSGSMNSGWAPYLTLYSLENNLRPDGTARINVNQDDLQKLYNDLSGALGNDAWATFIVAYRANGPYKSSGSQPAGEQVKGDQLTSDYLKYFDLTKKGKSQLKTIVDLIGAKVQVTVPVTSQQSKSSSSSKQSSKQNQQKTILLESPFASDPGMMDSYLTTLMDDLTVNASNVIPGRININQASRTVLLSIPGMTSDIVDAIISQRSSNPAQSQPNRKYETWILSEGVVTLDQMKSLMPYVSAGGNVFRGQAIGYFDGGGPTVRVEFVLDATSRPAKLLFWRDLSHLGRGYSLETLGIEAPD